MNRRFVEVEWDENRRRIICRLPLTSPTGHVRVKRDGEPLATRQTLLRDSDVLEWQIAYRDENRRPVELGKILQLALMHNMISKTELSDLEKILEEQEEFFEEKFAVKIEHSNDQFCGFRVHWRKYPVLVDDSKDQIRIEIELRHRQRAVGFQSMVFLRIPLSECEPRGVIGRRARPKEHVLWSPSREVLRALVKAFAVASRAHRDDVLKLLQSLEAMQGE